MNTKLSLTEKDFIVLALRSYVSGTAKITGFIFAALLAGIGIWMYTSSGADFWIIPLSFLPAAIYIYSILKIIPQNAAETFRHSSYASFSPEFSINANSVTITRGDKNSSEIKLKDLKSVMETKKYFYFFITQNNYIILPKRLLNAEDEAYVHSVVLSLPKNQRKNPYKIPIGRFILTMLSILFVIFCVVMTIWSYTVKF